MNDEYRTLVARLLALEPLTSDGLRCVYLPSFSPEVALALTGQSLTISTLARSAWSFLEKRRGSPYGDPVVDWVEPARSSETLRLSAEQARHVLQRLPPPGTEAKAFGIDGMTVDLAWRLGTSSGHASAWVGVSTPETQLARELLDTALRHASFDATRAALEQLLRYFPTKCP